MLRIPGCFLTCRKIPEIKRVAAAKANQVSLGDGCVSNVSWEGSEDVVKIHHEGVPATTAETLYVVFGSKRPEG